MFEAMPPADRVMAPLRAWGDDVIAAARFLTRLPLDRIAPPTTGLLARSMRAFPIVGAGIGALGWAALAVASALGLPVAVSALLALLTMVAVTGALHEDGLADTADGFGGGEDRVTKLAIMRDSRSGAFGIIALVFSLGLRATAIAGLAAAAGGAGPALIAAHSVSRGALPIMMRFLEPARSDGLGASAGQPDDVASLWCLGIGIFTAILCLGFGRAVIALAVVAALTAGLSVLARRQIGGYTGDVLGAAQQVGEMAMLLTAVA